MIWRTELADENQLATAKRIALHLHTLATEVADADSHRAQHWEDDDAWRCSLGLASVGIGALRPRLRSWP